MVRHTAKFINRASNIRNFLLKKHQHAHLSFYTTLISQKEINGTHT